MGSNTKNINGYPALRDALTKRELIILKLVAKGCATRQIADRLHVSIETIRKHLKNSYGKLDAHNKIEALRKCGLI